MIAKILSRLCDVKAPLASAVAAMHCNLAQVWNTKSGPWQLTLRVFKIAELWGLHAMWWYSPLLKPSESLAKATALVSNATDLNWWSPCFHLLLLQQVLFSQIFCILCSGNECLLDELCTGVPFPSGDHIGLVVICLLFQETHLADVRC